MMFDDKQELEQFLIGTLQDAFPSDLTAMYKDTENQSREERLEEELCLCIPDRCYQAASSNPQTLSRYR